MSLFLSLTHTLSLSPTHTHTNTHTHTYTPSYIIHTYMHAHIHKCTYTHTCTCMHAYTYQVLTARKCSFWVYEKHRHSLWTLDGSGDVIRNSLREVSTTAVGKAAVSGETVMQSFSNTTYSHERCPHQTCKSCNPCSSAPADACHLSLSLGL